MAKTNKNQKNGVSKTWDGFVIQSVLPSYHKTILYELYMVYKILIINDLYVVIPKEPFVIPQETCIIPSETLSLCF